MFSLKNVFVSWLRKMSKLYPSDPSFIVHIEKEILKIRSKAGEEYVSQHIFSPCFLKVPW